MHQVFYIGYTLSWYIDDQEDFPVGECLAKLVQVCRGDPGRESFTGKERRRHHREVVGHRAGDFFAPELVASYEAQDRAVLATGQAVRNQLEVIAETDRAGAGRWYLTSKVRGTTAEHGTVVIATCVDAQLGDRAQAATGLRAAIELAHDRCHEPLRVGDLAAAAEMSADRLERAMQRTLATSPKQYILRIRAERAATLLVTTHRSIARIAADCGYYDQSQLTRQFRRHIGTTPSAYRSGSTGAG